VGLNRTAEAGARPGIVGFLRSFAKIARKTTKSSLAGFFRCRDFATN
jgi:hypothetical protein